MNYFVRDIEAKEARYFKKSKYSFDYIERDSFVKVKERESASVIGYMEISEIEKGAACDKVVISKGLNDYYFKFNPVKKEAELKARRIIGYVLAAENTYIAIYKKNILLPVALSFTIVNVLLAILFRLMGFF